MSEPTHAETLGLFSRWRGGDTGLEPELLEQVYAELRQVASRYLRRERRAHTLHPTELVNEALVRLLGIDAEVSDRAHFFSLAARAMRRVLVDYSRRLQADKRPSSKARQTLVSDLAVSADTGVDVLVLHQALDRFARISPRAAKVVEMRYFAGLTNAECALVLGSSVATVERDWHTARVWLLRELRR
ncbi:MAG: ECF-type sigma factor [Acidobacteriota bacterium]